MCRIVAILAKVSGVYGTFPYLPQTHSSRGSGGYNLGTFAICPASAGLGCVYRKPHMGMSESKEKIISA